MMSATNNPGDGAGLPPGDFSEIVGAVYECVLDPRGWPGAIGRIRDAVGGAAAWIAVHYPGQVRSVYEIEVGTDPEQQRRLRAEYLGSSPFIGAVHHFRAGEVISVGDVIDYDEFTAGRFYREWSGPQGWPDFIMGVLSREPERFTWLGVCLPERATKTQKLRVASFLPHVERALRISDLIEQKSAQAEDLAAVVERMATGMVLVDASHGVHGVNSAAGQLLRGARDLSVAHGELRIARTANGAHLIAAIAACVDGRIDQAGATLLFESAAGDPDIVVHVLPLAKARGVPGSQAVAALFLSNSAAPAAAPIEAFVKRYRLTPSETRVLMAMMDGRSPKAIAAAQGVGMPTVRTHLSRVYEKTGTSGQTEVVRLLASVGRSI